MESSADSAPPPTMASEDNHTSVFKSDELVVGKYSDSQSLYKLPKISEDSRSLHTHNSWDQVHRFVAYFYAKHICEPIDAAWCRDPRTLLRGPTRVILFDNDGWLLTRLPSHPTSRGNLIFAAASISKIYAEWRRREFALSAYHRGVAAQGKSPCRRVRIAPGDHRGSVFENKEQGLFVPMEIDGDGEIMFYHECLHCQDLTCKHCTEVLDSVVAFGQRHTQVDSLGLME